MSDYQESKTWKRTLGERRGTDKNKEQRELLRTTYYEFRKLALNIASETSRHLPNYTLHNESHFDRLWNITDILIGPKFSVTPMEAFVLGGAFLIHDLGMALVAYPKGLDQLKESTEWRDIVSSLLQEKLNRVPTIDEIENPDLIVIEQAIGKILRGFHNKQAENLCIISWNNEYLIDNYELRQQYGKIIGRIAQSHGWSITKLSEEFKSVLSTPPTFPISWTVDPLKLACILRVADACHIDASRAPYFLRILRDPPLLSKEHWIFQGYLQQPIVSDNRIIYTSGHSFTVDEASAWWLCYDTLNMIDKELRLTDALLADLKKMRLMARGVAGIESPRTLAELIPTENWEPVDTRIKISNIPELIKKFGGEQLYGRNLTVPLRELIQNGIDAIHVRKLFDRPNDNLYSICVRIGKDDEGDWIEVEDNGVGMSKDLLVESLLDFGKSNWNSFLIIKEYPGILSKGFRPIGKYGIGFFSVFMWGKHVKVITRRFNLGYDDTLVLEFNNGLKSRPILRKAQNNEILKEGGTCVKVWFIKKIDEPEGLLYSIDPEKQYKIEDICKWLCPSIDVNLFIESGGSRNQIISSYDWIKINNVDFLKRILVLNGDCQEIVDCIKDNIRTVTNKDGETLLRACILPHEMLEKYNRHSRFNQGVVTVGGFRASSTSSIIGILKGNSLTIARDLAIPQICKDDVSSWATEQAVLACKTFKSPEEQIDCARIVRALGGDTSDLFITLGVTGWLNQHAILNLSNLPDEILLAHEYDYRLKNEILGDIKLNNNVFVCTHGAPIFLSNRFIFHDWPNIEPSKKEDKKILYYKKSIEGLIIELLAKYWSTSFEDVFNNSKFSNFDSEIKREIGHVDNKPITCEVDIIRKPNEL